MKHPAIALLASALVATPWIAANAQRVQQSQAIASSDVLSQISMFNYREGGKSDLVFRGTPIAANAQGEARVRFENGNASISAEVKDLPPAYSLGPYTTYILWALTPDGRAFNQGVLAGPSGGKGELETTYGASQFTLIVTAEPHFAVSLPSTMIVLYNVADDVNATESRVSTLVERADYSKLTSIQLDKDKNPVALVQARYAVAIAEAAGAQRYAPESYAEATSKLAGAEAAYGGKHKERKAAPDAARESVLAGEDARRAAMTGTAAAAEEQRRTAAAEAAAETASAAATEAANRAAAQQARADLTQRLNAALPTRETDRGLVSEIGGVQFATGTANLSAAARESLARFAGIVVSYPGLRFEIEGHTDSTGSDATNKELSFKRAITVRDYLIGQGVAASSIDAQGFGPSQPVADNGTADGRARNRRVEIVLSGGPLSTGEAAAAAPPARQAF